MKNFLITPPPPPQRLIPRVFNIYFKNFKFRSRIKMVGLCCLFLLLLSTRSKKKKKKKKKAKT